MGESRLYELYITILTSITHGLYIVRELYTTIPVFSLGILYHTIS